MSRRIAILAHSTNPRGGVVHALELGNALARLGHDVTVHAPDATGAGFFRSTLCKTMCIPASPVGRDVTDMVRIRAADYVRYFADPAARDFDIFHAQDGISGNALATLAEQGLIPGYVRTVHHVDNFAEPQLRALQRRSIISARSLLVVSRTWRDWLATEWQRASTIVGNGVDATRYSPAPDATDAELRARFDLGGTVYLAVGGVEARKNTLRVLDAFRAVYAARPAKLVIAGGVSLLDHGTYQAEFAAALAASELPENAVIRTGKMPDRLMPALYRAAAALVFPSVKEGFGLAVLEAMASGVPAIVSSIAPFTEYLGPDDALWCDPADPTSIAAAMTASLDPAHHARLAANGMKIAARFTWEAVAQSHVNAYAAMTELADA